MRERRCDLTTSIHVVIFGHQMRSAVCCKGQIPRIRGIQFLKLLASGLEGQLSIRFRTLGYTASDRFMTNFLRWFTFVLCLPSLVGRGAAQVAPLIANINARQTTSLDGQWQAIIDPYDVGALDYRAQPLKNNHAFYKDYKPQSESELFEYDFDTSGQLHVPGDWNTQRE